MANYVFPTQPEPVKVIAAESYNISSYQYEFLVRFIYDFRNTLNKEREEEQLFVPFGTTGKLLVCDIHYQNPNILIFEGFVGSKKAFLVQNMNQLNFLLTSHEVASGRPRKIGFDPPVDLTSEPPENHGTK